LHKCIPMLNGGWSKSKSSKIKIWDESVGTYVDAITTGDFLTCFYGGIISVIEVPGNMSKGNYIYVTAEQLNALKWSGVTSSLVNELNRVLNKYDITTTERIRHFLAQCMQETNRGAWLTEGDHVNWESQAAYVNYYDTKTKYKYKYRGSGFIQLTWDYGYQAFATYMIKQDFSNLEVVWKSPNKTDTGFLERYKDAVKKAEDKGYNIDRYKNIVIEGADYVAKEFAWEAAGYDWMAKNLNSIVDNLNANDKNEADKVTAKINKWTDEDSYKNRRDYYAETISIIK